MKKSDPPQISIAPVESKPSAESIPINSNLNSPNPRRKLPTEQDVIKFDEQQLHRPLTPHEKQYVHEQVKYMNEHQGHEGAHSEMLLIIFSTLIISQLLITVWKKYSLHTYNLATLLGLWLVPLGMSISKGYWRFVAMWTLFSFVNTYIVRKAFECPMDSRTPKLVYWWFQRVYGTLTINLRLFLCCWNIWIHRNHYIITPHTHAFIQKHHRRRDFILYRRTDGYH